MNQRARNINAYVDKEGESTRSGRLPRSAGANSYSHKGWALVRYRFAPARWNASSGRVNLLNNRPLGAFLHGGRSILAVDGMLGGGFFESAAAFAW